jgi:hypothetical protein
MQGFNRTSASARTVQLARVFLGFILFALVIGLWACLWVPPWPIF